MIINRNAYKCGRSNVFMRCYKCGGVLNVELLHDGEYCLICQGDVKIRSAFGKVRRIGRSCGCVGHVSLEVGQAINSAARAAMDKHKLFEREQQEFEDEETAEAFRNLIKLFRLFDDLIY